MTTKVIPPQITNGICVSHRKLLRVLTSVPPTTMSKPPKKLPAQNVRNNCSGTCMTSVIQPMKTGLNESGMAPPERESGCLFKELPVNKAFRDLDGVQRRPFAQIVRHNPHRKAVFHRRILADARNIRRILACAFDGRDIAAVFAAIDDEHAGRLAQDFAGTRRRDGPLEFYVDGFRMAHKPRHAHAGGGELDIR